jgi:hypothetical protein
MPRVRASQGLESSELRRYALVGAQARLAAITSELAAIRRAFPELANGNVGAATATGDSKVASRRRRSRMSAAQRKAVGERMKKYWAARRAAASGTTAKSENGAAAALPKRRRTPRAKASAKPGARKMSAAGRKRISDAQKARWAKRKGATA